MCGFFLYLLLFQSYTTNQVNVVCPDVMANLVSDFSETRNNLKVLGKKIMAFKIKAPNGETYVFEKDEVAKFCQVYDGIVLSQNCVEVM